MLLQDKTALIFGVANNKSIAYAIAKMFKEQGASIALNYLGEALKKRVEPISQELKADFIFDCDVSKDEQIERAKDLVEKKWGKIDILIHSVAFAQREDLQGRFIDTSREGFHVALDVSTYSLVKLCQVFEPLFSEQGSVITLSYYGAQKVIKNYNVMGIAKAALEASVRYLALDLGEKNVRINAISAGPIKTLAASGISGFKTIFKTIEEKAPLKRNITQEEVAKTALYLASHLSSGVTGETIFVDAGYNILGI